MNLRTAHSLEDAPQRGAPLDVACREGISVQEFATDFLFANKPVVITDGLQQWAALNKWTPEFFRSNFGDRTVPIGDHRVRVAEFVEQVLAATDSEPAPYLTGTGPGNYLLDLFPELSEDIQPLPAYLFPNWLGERFWFPLLAKRLNRGPQAEIFFGGRGSGFPCLHWDSLYFHAFNGQVYGEKEWILFAPDQGELLYPKSDAPNQSQVDNAFAPDSDRFPLATGAKRFACTVRAGQLLFIPAGWWHTTRMTGPSISVAVNAANASNWKNVRSELVAKAKSKSALLGTLLDLYLKRVEQQRTNRVRQASG